MIKILFIILLFVGFINAETLDIGGDRVQIANGTITEKDAKIVFTKCNSLYKRGEYFQVITIMKNFIKHYKGKKLPDAYFLKAKAEFMVEHYKDSYNNFLKLYDTYPESSIVKKGKLAKTIKKACPRLLKSIKNGYKADNYPSINIDHLIKHIALYEFITGKKDLRKLVESLPNFSTSYTKTTTYEGDEDDLIKLEPIGVREGEFCYKYSYIRAKTSKFIVENEVMYALDYFISNIAKHELRDYYQIENNVDFIYDDGCDRISGSEYFIDFTRKPFKIDMHSIWTEKIKPEKYAKDINFKFNIKNYTIQVVYFYYSISEGSDEHKFKITIKFLPIKELIIAKHGSLYDWVGLKRVDDAL